MTFRKEPVPGKPNCFRVFRDCDNGKPNCFRVFRDCDNGKQWHPDDMLERFALTKKPVK